MTKKIYFFKASAQSGALLWSQFFALLFTDVAVARDTIVTASTLRSADCMQVGHKSAYTPQRPDNPSRVPVNTPTVLSQRQADVRIARTYLSRLFFSLLRRRYCLFRRSQQVRTHRALRDAKANNGCKKK